LSGIYLVTGQLLNDWLCVSIVTMLYDLCAGHQVLVLLRYRLA